MVAGCLLSSSISVKVPIKFAVFVVIELFTKSLSASWFVLEAWDGILEFIVFILLFKVASVLALVEASDSISFCNFASVLALVEASDSINPSTLVISLSLVETSDSINPSTLVISLALVEASDSINPSTLVISLALVEASDSINP